MYEKGNNYKLICFGMIIPNISAKAIDVSNEDELRAAIEQGGDISLTNDIEVTQPLVIDKDVNIDCVYGSSIFMRGDNTLMTVNNGNVKLNNVYLYAGWNGEYFDSGTPISDVVKDQGTALVVNVGNVNLDYAHISAGKLGLEVNDGTITGRISIDAGEDAFITLGFRPVVYLTSSLSLSGSGTQSDPFTIVS